MYVCIYAWNTFVKWTLTEREKLQDCSMIDKTWDMDVLLVPTLAQIFCSTRRLVEIFVLDV